MKMPNNFIKKMSETILQSLQNDEELKKQLQQEYNDYKENDKNKNEE